MYLLNSSCDHADKAESMANPRSQTMRSIPKVFSGTLHAERAAPIFGPPFGNQSARAPAPRILDTNDNGLMLPTAPLQAMLESSSGETAHHELLHSGEHSADVQHGFSTHKSAVTDFTLVQVTTFLHSLIHRKIDVQAVLTAIVVTAYIP
jgi:hypothetical protein